MPTQSVLADVDSIGAVLTCHGNMERGILVASNDKDAIKLYCGVIGAEYRFKDEDNNTIAPLYGLSARPRFLGHLRADSQ